MGMFLQVFSVRDSKAEAWLQPFFSLTRGQAIRTFSDAANDAEHQFSRHAEDYSLWYIGDFDQLTGVMAPAAPIECLGKAVEFLVRQEELPFGKKVSNA